MPVPDQTKALLALVVPLVSVVALGVALLVTFGSGASTAPVFARAPVSAPSMHTVTGSMPSLVPVCAPRQPSTTPVHAGSAVVTVDATATSVTAVWLPALTPAKCQARITHGGAAIAAKLAAALDDEPAVGAGVFMCPNDDGSSVVLYFAYGKGHAAEVATVALSGCQFISDPGRTSRWWLKPGSSRSSFGELLATLAPNPWRSSIGAALEAA